jgi:hypothetical protein
MTKFTKIQLIIVSLINLTLVLKMISIAWKGNDKAIILVIFGYPTLIILNALIWITLRILKRPEYEIYKLTTIGLAILFIPTILATSMF